VQWELHFLIAFASHANGKSQMADGRERAKKAPRTGIE